MTSKLTTALTILALTTAALAVSPKTWTEDQPTQLEAGTLQQVVSSNLGRLTLAKQS